MFGIVAPLNTQTSSPSSVRTTRGAASAYLAGNPALEHVGRLDDVVVDADEDHVLDVHATGTISLARSSNARSPRRCARPRPVVGDRGPARRAAARRARRRRRSRSSRPAATRSATTAGTRCGTGRGDRSRVDLKNPAGRRGVPPARRRRRRARRDVPARRHRPARHRVTTRCTRATRASSTARAPRTPRATASRDRPGYDALVQASSGQQWEQPGWRMGPIFLHMPMPSMGAMFLVPDRHPRRADRARGRPVAASTCARRCSRARCSTRRRSGRTSGRRRRLLRVDGQVVPAGRAPGDDLRGRRRRVGALVGHERARADQEPGRAPRPARRVRSRALHDAVGRGARRSSRRCAAPRTSSASATGSSTSSARTTTRSRRSTRWRTRSARDGAPHPQLVANDMVATVDDPELGHHDAGRRADPPARHAGRDPGAAPDARRSTTTRSSARSATRRDEIATFTGGGRDARARRRASSSTSASTSRDRSARWSSATSAPT